MVIATEKFETEEQQYEDKVDRIWVAYDKDMDGMLSQEDSKEFLKETLKELTGNEPSEEYVTKNFMLVDESQTQMERA